MDRLGSVIQCNPSVKLTKGESYPMIDMEKITVGQKHVAECDYSIYEGQSSSKFCSGDTIMARITPCLENGKIAQYKGVEKAFGSTEFFVFRGIPEVSDSDYIYYLMSSKYIRDSAANSMTGASGRQRADLTFIKKIKWELPNIATQRRIAEILSAYDELIENNNKRIALLEKAAQELYKEWFVRFRFPGYEEAEFEESAIGDIPKDFVVVKTSDILKYYVGGGWGEESASEDYPVGAFVIRGTDFPKIEGGIWSSCPFRFHKKSNYISRELKAWDIILEVSGGTQEQPVGRTLIVTPELLKELENRVICASFCKQLRCNEDVISPVYYYFWMQYLYDTRIIEKYQLQSTGIINFKFDYFYRKGFVLLPPSELMSVFESKVKEIYKLKDNLASQNTNLIKQRDLLLPRLMSGKLEV